MHTHSQANAQHLQDPEREGASLAPPSPGSDFTQRLGMLFIIGFFKGMYYLLICKHKKNILLKDLKISLWTFSPSMRKIDYHSRMNCPEASVLNGLTLLLSTGF